MIKVIEDNLNLIIASNNKIFCKGLVSVLGENPSIGTIRVAMDAEVLLQHVISYEPHVVILDLDIPKIDGFKSIKVIAKQYPRVKLLAFSRQENSKFIKYLKKQGIHDYFGEGASLKTLENKLRSLSRLGL